MSNPIYRPDATSLRSIALDLLSTLRQFKSIDKEQLFANAIAFYGWFFANIKEKSDMRIYTRAFISLHPTLCKADPSLQEACFITWFIINGFDQLPLLSEGEIESPQRLHHTGA